jgi:hypothetical protein
VKTKEAGLKGSVKSVFSPVYREIQAVNNISRRNFIKSAAMGAAALSFNACSWITFPETLLSVEESR